MKRPFRIAAVGVVLVAAIAAGLFWGLTQLFPSYMDRAPTLAAVTPLPSVTRSSLIVAPISIPLSAIQEAIETGIPKDLAGKPEIPLPPMLASLDLTYTLAREPFVITAAAEGFSLTADLKGTLRATGLQNLPMPPGMGGQAGSRPDQRGSGASRGGFGPPGFPPPPPGFPMPPGFGGPPPFPGGAPPVQSGRTPSAAGQETSGEQSAALSGRIAITVRPDLRPEWRLEPNLTAQASISDVSLTIMGNMLSPSNELKSMLERIINQQLATLQTRLNDTPMLEQSARRAWSEMCRSIPLGAGAPGVPHLWLEFRPVEALSAQPRIDQTGLSLTLGTRAETRVVPAATRPDCPFPARLQIVAPMEQGRVNIDVPVDIPFAEVTRLIEAQLKGKTFPVDGGGALKATVRSVKLAASGDRILMSLGVKANETHTWFGLAADVTVHVWGRPDLDRQRRVLRFENVAVDVESEAAFGVLGFAGRAAAPYLQKTLADNAVIDLAPLLANARENIEAAVVEFRRNAPGIVLEATVDDVRLAGIQFDSNTLRVIAEADGTVRVNVTRLAPQ